MEDLMTDQTPAADLSPDLLVTQMPEYLIPDKAGNTSATIQFDLSGQDDGKATSGKGEVESPNMTMIADSGDFEKIMTGQLDGTAAFMSGKLKIKGDMGLAIRMQSMFQ